MCTTPHSPFRPSNMNAAPHQKSVQHSFWWTMFLLFHFLDNTALFIKLYSWYNCKTCHLLRLVFTFCLLSKVIEGKLAHTFYCTKGIIMNGKDYHFKISCTIILDLMISLHLSIFGKTACQKIQYGGAKTRISQAWMEEVGYLIPSSCIDPFHKWLPI